MQISDERAKKLGVLLCDLWHHLEGIQKLYPGDEDLRKLMKRVDAEVGETPNHQITLKEETDG